MTIVPLNELPEYVRNVRATIKASPALSRATVIALRGDLGVGKTTLVQTLARDMGIDEPVLSPTYVLMRSYVIHDKRLPNGAPRRFNRLVHIDAYRFEKPEQWAQLRPEEFLSDPCTLVLVEWPEKVEGFMPKPDLTIDIKEG
ncbi:MAG TPA: tRNA (adenosine(37)-N6)-threonylcarbamoyltransferase complex ATPase subunit type 1 TsaE, partial [Candidatus Paceibacterota bacterium]